MKNLNFIIFTLIIVFNCYSQENTKIESNLKSSNLVWIKNLNEEDSIETKLKMIKNKILSDSISKENIGKRRISLKLEHGESINQKLKEQYENSDYECRLFFILNLKKNYGISLNRNTIYDSEKVLNLIKPKDLDSIYTSSDFDTLKLYGSNYCGLIVLYSSNGKLKRKIKNVL